MKESVGACSEGVKLGREASELVTLVTGSPLVLPLEFPEVWLEVLETSVLIGMELAPDDCTPMLVLAAEVGSSGTLSV